MANLILISKNDFRNKNLSENEEHKVFMKKFANELGYNCKEDDTLSIGIELSKHDFTVLQESDYYCNIFLPEKLNYFQYYLITNSLLDDKIYSIFYLDDVESYKNYQETINFIEDYQKNHKFKK